MYMDAIGSISGCFCCTVHRPVRYLPVAGVQLVLEAIVSDHVIFWSLMAVQAGAQVRPQTGLKPVL